MMIKEKANRSLLATLSLLLFLFAGTGCRHAMAQQFTVGRFNVLPNDISAYISPVRDLNGEACALVKVTAPADFVFSSPLGIVKRKDEVGEIWLYLPHGTKRLTIKHPQWGVMRDYKFNKTLESRMTYELTITPPKELAITKHDTIVLTKTVVDTVTVRKRRAPLPLSASGLLTVAAHTNGPSWGVMLAMLRRHGLFVHAQCDFGSIGETTVECDKSGMVDGSSIMPYYSGKTRHSNYALTAGLIHRLGRHLCLFEGAGYGKTATAWQLAEVEGGGYALNRSLTHKGWAAELGFLVRIHRLSLSLSALTVAGKQWQGCIGIGMNITKRHKK